MSFLPENFEIPTAETGYMKLTQGAHKFRIMSDAILGYVAWIDPRYNDGKPKPERFRMEEQMVQSEKWKDNPKHFWAFVVWNYKAKRFQILDITQKTIQREIKDLHNNQDWGDPHNYDITITRSGEGKDNTTYTVQPAPPTELDKEISEEYEKLNINLDALYEGEDPFENVKGDDSKAVSEASPEKTIKPNDLPF